MPIYQYKAVDDKGKDVGGQIESISRDEALSKLHKMGVFPTNIFSNDEGRKIKVKDKPLRRRNFFGRVKTNKLAQFADDLATLQDAGISIVGSLRVLEKQEKHRTFKRIIGCIADDIENGCTLSEAMGRHPKCFDTLFVNMVAAGEIGGVLDEILLRLAKFMEKAENLKAKVKGAMAYPIAVMSAAAIIVIGLMVFIVPSFAEVLSDIGDGEPLPKPTLILMNMSNWLIGRHGMNALIIISMPIIIVMLFKFLLQFRICRYGLDTVCTRYFPVVRKIVYKTSVARWTRTLGTLLHAGVQMLDAIKITRNTAGNEIYANMLVKVNHSIRNGSTFAKPLEDSKTVDSMVVSMIAVGEQTGEMDAMLEKIANKFDNQADLLINAMMSLLEPLMILFLGFVIGLIVVAMYLPIIEIIKNMM